MRRKVLVLVLLFTMMPSASEVVELVAHAVRHGDYAHAADGGHSEPSGGDEHGCSTLFHTCHCHGSASGAAAPLYRLALSPASFGRVPVPLPANSHERDPEPPPIRPPIV